jgi:hypothetical protein
MDEPLTEAVGDTQMALQAYAWSEEPEEPPTRKRRGQVIIAAILAFVALAVAWVWAWAVIALVPGGHHPQAAVPSTAPSSTPIITAPTKPPSHDDSFIAALINHGAQIQQTDIALHNAHGVCDLLGQGVTSPDITDRVREAVDGYTETRAAIFVALSIDYYCPQYGT